MLEQSVPGVHRTAGVAVVIPCYRVVRHINALLAQIGPEATHIYVVDDACPENSGAHVQRTCRDPRVRVLFHAVNQGVGGAVITGYLAAMAEGVAAAVKLDGDGQMDPSLIPRFIEPILTGQADYVKGNRFYHIDDVVAMPLPRLVGNAVLSFMTKLSSGYWNVVDPTNGYTAVSTRVLSHIPLAKVSRRYFFESDLLFRLGTVGAHVVDLPMTAIYGDEQSGLKIAAVIGPFLAGNLRNFGKRIFYNYFLRGFSVASIELVIGMLLLVFGVVFGSARWLNSIQTNTPATTGTVMVAAISVILGVQLLLSFLGFDIAATPRRAVSPLISLRTVDPTPIAPLRTPDAAGSQA